MTLPQPESPWPRPKPSAGAWLLFVVIWLCLAGTAFSTGGWWLLLLGPFACGLMFAMTKPTDKPPRKRKHKRIF